MYLDSLDQRSAAIAENRRRFPRVKPDRFGRFNFEDLTPVSFDIRSLLPALKNPRLLAVGGVIVGTVLSAVIAIAVVGQPPAAVVVASTGAQDKAPVAIALPEGSPAQPILATKVEIKAPHQEPLRTPSSDSVAAVVSPSSPRPEEHEAALRPDTRDSTSPSDSRDRTAVLVIWPIDAGSLVVMPQSDDDGSLTVMPGPSDRTATPALIVMQ